MSLHIVIVVWFTLYGYAPFRELQPPMISGSNAWRCEFVIVTTALETSMFASHDVPSTNSQPMIVTLDMPCTKSIAFVCSARSPKNSGEAASLFESLEPL